MLKRIATASIVLMLVASAAAFAATQTTGTKVTLHNTSLGKRLATSTGRTLYYLTSGTCGAGCTSTWPPLMTSAKPVAGMGVNKALLGTVKRGTKLQVTYNHHPVYRYTGDSAAGQANGEGASGVWFTLKSTGRKG